MQLFSSKNSKIIFEFFIVFFLISLTIILLQNSGYVSFSPKSSDTFQIANSEKPLQIFKIETRNNPSVQNQPVNADFFNNGTQIISRSSPVIFAASRKPSQTELINPDIYSVENGDSIDSVAKKFSLNKEVLALFNNLKIDAPLTANQKLLVPPKEIKKTYTVKRGNTLFGISKNQGVSIESLAFINRKAINSIITPGEKLLIPPGGEYRYLVNAYETISKFIETVSAKSLLDGFFITPVSGINWGIPHSRNAIDIAAPCGSPVYAAAAGIVIGTGFGDDLGRYIKIQHYDGLSTATYAHLSTINKNVKNGVKLDRGSLMGSVGNTGKVVGSTGCHLHFEVLGRKNPLINTPE